MVTGGYHDPSTAPNTLRYRRRNYLRRKPSIPRFRFSLFERPGTCPFDALAARTGRRAAGSATRKSSSPHYGGNQQIDFRELSAAAFEALWRVGCFGGFLVGREAARRLAPLGHGTIIFTGASASLGGKPGFAHFAAAKAGLRMITQSMARKYGPLGIHVAHVVIDGGIDGDRLRNRAPTLIKERGEDGLLGIDAIAETYWHIHRQPRSAWTQVVDLRPFKETF
jgi:NAD(P)-dependent dehydrogenase (short-subunit alcohol dehydrogenase family)